MLWVSNACIYGSVSKRRRELIGKSTEPSFQFAKRVMELHLLSPVSPLARLSEHLDQVTRSSPPEMDPNNFVEQTYSHITTLLQESCRVANYVQYRIGTLLNKMASRHQLGIVDLELALALALALAYPNSPKSPCDPKGSPMTLKIAPRH